MGSNYAPGYPEGSSKRASGFENFFGPTRGDNTITTPYSAYPRETLALPDVYKGSNPYLTNIILTIISDEQLIPTRILMPIRQTENETSITWDEFHFNEAVLGAVPEEGVSRLVTQQVSERRDHYVRYGLAFMIEHGFMQSPKGQMTYNANLEQIRDAVLQSLYIGVIESLLKCKTNSQFFMQQYGRTLTAQSARKRMEMEVQSFAEIQKTDHGWEMLNSRAQRTLRLMNVVPDAWVLDDGVKKYIATRRENWAYFLHGEDGEKLRAQNQGAGNPTMLDAAANTLIFETKQFQLPHTNDPVNITSRRRSIGEYMVSFPHLDYSSCGKYTSAMRDIMIYDENRDGYAKLSLADGLQHCQRFDHDDGSLYAGGYDTRQHGPDMFFTEEHPQGVQYIGQMEKEHMSNLAINDWVTSVIARFTDQEKAELTRNLACMTELVSMLESQPDFQSANNKAYFTYVVRAHGQGVGPVDSVIRYFNPDTGMLKLDPLLIPGLGDGDRASNEMIPYGFASYAGICEIAKHSDAVLKIGPLARSAKAAIDMITQKIDSFSYQNLFTQQYSVPFYFKNKCSKEAVFTNLLHKRRPPVIAEVKLFDLMYGDAHTPYTDISEEDLRKAFLDALNLSRVAENRTFTKEMEAKSKEYAKKVTEVVMQICQNISKTYRTRLLKVLQALHTEEQLEEIYKTLMQNMSGHNWYTVCKAIDLMGTVGDPSTDSTKYDPEHSFSARMLETKNMVATDGVAESGVNGEPVSGKSSRKSVVTQLTCSEHMARFLQIAGGMLLVPDHGSLQSYDDYTASGFPRFGAGSRAEEHNTRRDTERAAKAPFSFLDKKRTSAGVDDGQPTEPDSYHASWDEDKMLCSRIKDVSAMHCSTLERTLALAFIGNEVNHKTFERFITTGCVFPFNIIYARPFQTYSVSSGICMKAGRSTGETLVGHADFQLGDNVIQKLHYGNFTFYSKSVVYRQQNVYLANNMFSTAYNGGTGSDFFETMEHYDAYMETGGNDGRQRSIFAMLAPYSSKQYDNPINITGRHSGNLEPLNSSSSRTDTHFASANFYKRYWGWTEQVEDSPARCAFDNDDDGSPNTVCFQGHQSMFNPTNGGLFDIVIPNTGHWGPDVYAGVGKVRNGHAMVIRSAEFNNLYGGGGNLSGMIK
jgi:hypothetical protein